MHVGIDSFVAAVTDPETGRQVGPAERLAHLLEEIETADRVGLYSFGIGEHHRPEYYDSAPPVILAAAAARTERIRVSAAAAPSSGSATASSTAASRRTAASSFPCRSAIRTLRVCCPASTPTRKAARARKDYAAADAIRDQLQQSGLAIEDTPDGPRWTLC